MGWRQAHDTHERGAGDFHAGQVRGNGETVCNIPMNDKRFQKKVTQEAETGYLYGEGERFRHHFMDFNLQDIAGFRTVDVNGTGQGMHQVQVGGSHLFWRGFGIQLPVKGIPRFHADNLARIDLGGRFDIRVPAVVSCFGFFTQLSGTINTDVFVGFNGHYSVIS